MVARFALVTPLENDRYAELDDYVSITGFHPGTGQYVVFHGVRSISAMKNLSIVGTRFIAIFIQIVHSSQLGYIQKACRQGWISHFQIEAQEQALNQIVTDSRCRPSGFRPPHNADRMLFEFEFEPRITCDTRLSPFLSARELFLSLKLVVSEVGP